MPRMDGTGPTGQGAGTGRGLGPCGTGNTGFSQPNGQQSNWFGRMWGVMGGLGRRNRNGATGRGGGRGFGRGRGRRSF